MDIISKKNVGKIRPSIKGGENTYPTMQTFNKALSSDPLPTRLGFFGYNKIEANNPKFLPKFPGASILLPTCRVSGILIEESDIFLPQPFRYLSSPNVMFYSEFPH